MTRWFASFHFCHLLAKLKAVALLSSMTDWLQWLLVLRIAHLIKLDWFLALTNHSEQNAFPHLVNVIVSLDLDDPDATIWWLFPHGHFLVSEEKNVDFSWHLRRLLHKNIEIEEVLNRRNASKRFQLLSVSLRLLFAFPWLNIFLVLTLSWHITSFWLLSEVLERWLPLVVPELPVSMHGMALWRHKRTNLAALINSLNWLILVTTLSDLIVKLSLFVHQTLNF